MDIYGVIGWPIKHSLSPAMHNAVFKKLGIDAEYKAFEIKPEELEDFLLRDISVKDIDGNPIRSRDIVGFNITIPYKVRAKEILEKKFPVDKDLKNNQFLYYVKLSGAVNTVKRIGDKLEYWNTDATGFLHSLEGDLKFNTRRKTVLLVGCGGAGRAVIAALSWTNMHINKIYIYDVNDKAIKSTKEHFSKLPQVLKDIFEKKIEFISKEEISDKIENCQLLVNASPIGMKKGDVFPITKNLLHKELSVYDLVYNRETELVKDAKSLDLPAVTGRGMLASQGAFSFSLWTGVIPAKVIGIMREALDKAIK